jgi:hypothetical protein
MSKIVFAVAAGALLAAGAAAAGEKKVVPVRQGELVLYKELRYNGSFYTVTRDNSRVVLDWNIRSIGVHPGDRWEICAKPKYKAPCMVLTESLPDASKVGIEGGIGSARKAKVAK